MVLFLWGTWNSQIEKTPSRMVFTGTGRRTEQGWVRVQSLFCKTKNSGKGHNKLNVFHGGEVRTINLIVSL